MQETHTLIATIGDHDDGVVFSGASFDIALTKYFQDGWKLEAGNLIYTGEVRSSEGYVLGQRVLVILTRTVGDVKDISKSAKINVPASV